MVFFQSLTALAALPLLAAAAKIPGGGPAVQSNGKYLIESEGIRANFIPYGASISNLFIKDVQGVERDIVLGFDNATYYSIDKQHPHLGGVPGRYANRIKNATFEIDGVTYHTNANEHGGLNTLHGGADGWDWRNWTVVTHTTDSITFSLVDEDGEQGFPGQVISYVKYTVTPYQWHFSMTAFATTKKTPIMLSSHTYWNLDGFQNPNTPTALNHTLHLPYSGQRIATDGILIPNGTILPNQQYDVNDFWSSPKQIGANFSSPDLLGNCGTGCLGYDTAYIVNRDQNGPYDWHVAPVATLASPFSGIQVDVYSDQQAFQVYSCGGQNGKAPDLCGVCRPSMMLITYPPGTLTIKETQGFFNDSSRPRVTEQYGCIVMEVEDWIDAINQVNKPHYARRILCANADCTIPARVAAEQEADLRPGGSALCS